MSRSSRIQEEAESLWRAMTPEPPPQGLEGADLLSAAMKLTSAVDYDRIHSPYLRPTQITRPR